MDPLSFNFIMELGAYGKIASKQELISTMSCGANVDLMHIRSDNDRFGYFEVLYRNKKIGIVPKNITERFFKDGVLQNCRCTAVGLVPCGNRTVSCEIHVEILDTQPVIEADDEPDFCTLELSALPPKRKKTPPRIKNDPPLYVGKQQPVKRQFFKNETVILILCLLLPPIGIALLFIFSRRKLIQKLAVISVSVFVCVGVCFLYMMNVVNAPKEEIPVSNTPERVTMLFLESWQSQKWENLLYLSAPGTDVDVEDIENVFSAVKVSDFQFSEVYSSDSRTTYRLDIFELIESTKKKKNKKSSEENTEIEKEYKESSFTLDAVRVGTAWYIDIKSLNHELLYDPLESFFASDSHVVIEPVQSPIVYIDPSTMTYHYRKHCAPEGAPENKLSDAERKGYGPCGKCAR